MNHYRFLTATEISELESQACRCDDWSQVEVSEDFSPEHISEAVFSGHVVLGAFRKWRTLEGKVKVHSGISRAHIHNCTIGNDVLISNVGSYIANYDIADGAVLMDVGMLRMYGVSSFGNGDSIHVICEAGGMNVRMYDGLSSQMACLQAYYKHKSQMIAQLDGWIDQYVDSVSSERGTIGRGASIIGCRFLCNVRVGEYAKVRYADSLTEGTVLSDSTLRTFIGFGVIANCFIIAKGAVVTEQTRLHHCFVGQACSLRRGFSAEHSLFFANCEMDEGEAVSVFAGPFTVSHHKSTLLIAGHFSFMNAGSGSNQSNHLYKTGPVHHGVLERGCKTGSGSYIMWPARAGAFSVIIGKHYSHFDTTDLPFSYIIEKEGKSVLLPAANLCTSGTARDEQKWPQRDGRPVKHRTDRVHFDLWSPYMMQKVARAIQVLKQLRSSGVRESYEYHGVTIPAEALRKGLECYQLAVDCYVGKMLNQASNESQMSNDSCPQWLDLGGMFITETAVNNLISDIEIGCLNSLEMVDNQLNQYGDHYVVDERQYFASFFKEMKGKALSEVSPAELEEIRKQSVIAEEEFQRRVRDDAAKDADLASRF